MSSFVVRQASPSDKEAILNIHGNVYDGLDYLPAYFDDFMSCPLTTPYVALVDDKIVGFVATFVVDGGKTVVTRAGRLSPDVGGQGMYKQFQTQVFKVSDVSRHAFVTVNAHPSADKDSFRSVNKLILMKPLTRFLFDARSLPTAEENVETLHVPTDEDFKYYFSASAIRSSLFPRERILVDWVPYRLLYANIPLIRWSGKRTKIYSDISVLDDGHVIGLLTFSTVIPVQRPPYVCNLNIYGTDTSSLRNHVTSHISHIRSATDGVTSLLVLVEPEFNMQELEQTFKEIGLQKSEWHDSERPDKVYSLQYLFEKEIQP